jgi:hypothetical protein
MLAALWQGELIDALGAVAEDVDLRWHIPETNRRRYHPSSRVKAVRRLLRFSNNIAYPFIYKEGSLPPQANYISL